MAGESMQLLYDQNNKSNNCMFTASSIPNNISYIIFKFSVNASVFKLTFLLNFWYDKMDSRELF